MNYSEQEKGASKYLIKSGQLISVLPSVQPVSLAEWQQAEGSERVVMIAAAGVSLPGDIDLFDTGLLEHLHGVELIAVEFAAFTDGRGFSLATQLRQHGFRGELRATGAILVDQLHYLQRCGFDAFELDAKQDLTVALEALAAFSKAYQPGW